MRETFDAVGLIKLENTGAKDAEEMRDLAEIILSDGMEAYEGGANSRAEIAMNVFDTGAPKEAHLHYHHEMAYVSESTKALGFMALAQTSSEIGATYVSDAVGTTNMLMQTELGHKLREKGITYIRNLTDRESGLDDDPSNAMSGVYNHWQTSFGVETVEEVEKAAASKGLEFEWGGVDGHRFLKTKFSVSAFEFFPPLDRNLLYSSVADDSLWFDAWPGVMDLPTMGSFATATQDERPLKITYGDGTDFTREELQLYVDVYDAYGVPLWWRTGDVAVVCNHRWAHGRPSYELAEGEERTLGVVLGEMYPRLGQYDNKW